MIVNKVTVVEITVYRMNVDTGIVKDITKRQNDFLQSYFR